jgi:hypothetical protein
MSTDYKIREVRVAIGQGVTVIVEVSSVDEIGGLLKDLRSRGFEPTDFEAETLSKAQNKKPPAAQLLKQAPEPDTPEGLVETRADLSAGSLATAKVLAFKDGVPQLLRPGTFSSVSDATLALIYALEVGVKNTNIAYEDFKAVFEAQNIKTGTPLPMLLSNLKNSGYVDKAAYGSNRTVRLTAKGEKKAEEVLSIACAGRAGGGAS